MIAAQAFKLVATFPGEAHFSFAFHQGSGVVASDMAESSSSEKHHSCSLEIFPGLRL